MRVEVEATHSASRRGDVVRYGLVGAGYFGAALGRAVDRLPGGLVTRIYDPSGGDAVAKELGAETCGGVDELVTSSKVDAVLVASPNWSHKEPVLASAAAGKDVFCEKPIALSFADCKEMVNACGSAGVLFMAGHVMNFMAGVRQAKTLIRAGAIGELLYCRAVRNGWEDAQPTISWKKRRDLSGGHLYHHIHELDFVQSIMGLPDRVNMIGGNVCHGGEQFGDEDDLLLIDLEFDGGRFARLEYGSAFRWPEHYVLIEGKGGAIRVDLQDTGVTVRAAGGEEKFLLHRSVAEDDDRKQIYRASTTDGAVMYGSPGTRPPLWLQGIVEEEMAYFHYLMSGNEPEAEFASLTDGTAAMAAVGTADALTRSMCEGRRVGVTEVVGSSHPVSHLSGDTPPPVREA